MRTGKALDVGTRLGEFAFRLAAALSNTLHHMEQYPKVLSEMLRVLKPGGFFVLNEMYHDNQDAARQVHDAQHTLEAKPDCLLGQYQRRT